MQRLSDICGWLITQDLNELYRRLERLIDTNVPLGECWMWKGTKSGGRTGPGYGDMSVWWGGEQYKVRVHRLVWVLHNRRNIPTDREIDHICDNSLCCNPHHLALVDRTINARRSAVNTNGKIKAKSNTGA